MDSVIKIENLTKDFGKGHGVFNASFDLLKGEVFGFLGPNGGGIGKIMIQHFCNACGRHTVHEMAIN